MKRLRWVLAAGAGLALSLCATGAAGQADGWDAIGPARIGASFADVTAALPLRCGDAVPLRCQRSGGTFAAVPMRSVEAIFQAGRLAQVILRFDSQHYPALLAALRERWGEPEDRSFRARAGMAGAFAAGVKLWPDLPAVLEEYAGKIDRGALTFGTADVMAPLIAAKRARPSGASGDI